MNLCVRAVVVEIADVAAFLVQFLHTLLDVLAELRHLSLFQQRLNQLARLVTLLGILTGRDLRKYFDVVSGATPDGSITTKGEVIRQALNLLHTPADRVLMVGDRKDDILGAKEAGTASAGALWGFSLPGELKAAGADFLFQTPKDLEQFLFGE